jgi:ATP-dependent DNA helicase RecG
MIESVQSALAAVRSGATAGALESEMLEFKTVGRSEQDALRALADASACFANARGGTVVVGVADDRGGPDAFVGCELDLTAVRRRIFELTDPPLTVGVEDLEYGGNRLVVISVPTSPDVHAVGGRATERMGAACEPMSTQRIATVVADRRGDDWSAEDAGLPLDQTDPVALALARSMLERASDLKVRRYAGETDTDLLRRLGLVTANGTLTNAGVVLFVNNPRLGEQLTYVYRRTPAGALVVNEHLEGPLLPALDRVFELVDARLDRTSVNVPGGVQLQIADLPEAAVREAIINGVMHRDYRRGGTVQVEHTATRMTVTSPGPFVSGVTPTNVLTTSSRSRNPALSRAVRTLGLAETAGTGVDRMYAEMARVGHQPPSFSDDHDRVQVSLLGGAPNATLARFTASLPAGEADDADTMVVLLTLLQQQTLTAAAMAPLLQKDERETLAVLERLAAEPVLLLERTRETARRTNPKFRLREHVVAALGPAVAYRRRTVDEYDRKIIGLVRETGEINARMVRLLLDLDVTATSRVLADLVEREILVKTSQAQRGPSVTYGAGPGFPSKRRRSTTARGSRAQPSLLEEDDATPEGS